VSGAQPEPMSAAQLAAVRACALLAAQHEPLVMTPGALRTLLGRYQRRLHDLAEAVLPTAAMADDTAGSREASAAFLDRSNPRSDTGSMQVSSEPPAAPASVAPVGAGDLA
jgi:hypothetical protein